MNKIKLGVNIDHIATLRQARGENFPSVLGAAKAALKGGAQSITVHLREDRRHIQDADVKNLRENLKAPINLEMAASPAIAAIALKNRVQKVCIVPEKRAELTTEGGLNAEAAYPKLIRLLPPLQKAGISVSLFLDPLPKQIKLASRLGARAVELHTGQYANAQSFAEQKRELKKLHLAAREVLSLGLELHAGHGLNYDNVQAVAAIPGMHTLNIGFAIVARAVFVGMSAAVRQMKEEIGKA
jgi:pyridoxine 5-phosphate synthase